MATRSQIEFYDSRNAMEEGDLTARLYHHWDGYPSVRLIDIRNAVRYATENYENSGGFQYRNEVGRGTEYAYMDDLAAFYILANKDGAGNVTIDNQIHPDIDYLYQVFPSRNGISVIIRETNSKFWENPILKNTKIVDKGTLKLLISRHKML